MIVRMYKTKDFDFNARWAFFAFGQSQFDEKKQEWVVYVTVPWFPWLIARKDNCLELIKAFDAHHKQESLNRLEADGIERIIAYELNNHECFYTWSIENVLFLCKEYWITEDEILKVYHKERVKYDTDWFLIHSKPADEVLST